MGGAGSGKSYGATQKILLKALNSKRRILVIRKIQNTIKHSIWSLMIAHLQNSGFYEYCRINRSDFEIELPNGSIFIFKGLDDPEKIKSIDGITDIVIEEATELRQDEFMQLNLRLRPKGKRSSDLPYVQPGQQEELGVPIFLCWRYTRQLQDHQNNLQGQ